MLNATTQGCTSLYSSPPSVKFWSFICQLHMRSSYAALSTSTRNRRTHYETLGLKRDASAKEIKSAYYSLSKLFHPDVNKDTNAAKKFQEITDAYDTLSNVVKRKDYDHVLTGSASAAPFASATEMGAWDAVRRSRVDVDAMHDFREFQKTWRKRNQPPPTGRTQYYDYDAHFRAHYGQQADGWQENAKEDYNVRRQRWLRQQAQMRNSKSMQDFNLFFSFGLVLLCFAASVAITVDMLSESQNKHDPSRKVLVKSKTAGEAFWEERDISKPWS